MSQTQVTEKEKFHSTFGEMKKYMLPDSMVAVMSIMFASYMLGQSMAVIAAERSERKEEKLHEAYD